MKKIAFNEKQVDPLRVTTISYINVLNAHGKELIKVYEGKFRGNVEGLLNTADDKAKEALKWYINNEKKLILTEHGSKLLHNGTEILNTVRHLRKKLGLEKRFKPAYPINRLLKFSPKQIKMGTKVEMEHTNKPKEAKKIARDHLKEFPDYYTHLNEMERKLKNRKINKAKWNPDARRSFKVPEVARKVKLPIQFTDPHMSTYIGQHKIDPKKRNSIDNYIEGVKKWIQMMDEKAEEMKEALYSNQSFSKDRIKMYKQVLDKAADKYDGVDYYVPDNDKEVEAINDDDEYAKKLSELFKLNRELGDSIERAHGIYENIS